MNASELTKTAMQKSGLDSTRKLGEALGVSHVTVTKWLHGVDCPTFENAAALATMAGLPPVSTAAEVRLNSSKDAARHRSLLKSMAALAASLVAVYTAIRFGSDFHGAAAFVLSPVYIMRN